MPTLLEITTKHVRRMPHHEATGDCHLCAAKPTSNEGEWLWVKTPWGERHICPDHLGADEQPVMRDHALRVALRHVMKSGRVRTNVPRHKRSFKKLRENRLAKLLAAKQREAEIVANVIKKPKKRGPRVRRS